jgi:hypothetical protein
MPHFSPCARANSTIETYILSDGYGLSESSQNQHSDEGFIIISLKTRERIIYEALKKVLLSFMTLLYLNLAPKQNLVTCMAFPLGKFF